MDNVIYSQINLTLPSIYNNGQECEDIRQYVFQQNILRTPTNRITIDYSQDDYRNMIITKPTISRKKKSKEEKSLKMYQKYFKNTYRNIINTCNFTMYIKNI
ncbi:uncharacterized protein LOC113550126 [Rhopalosiphum maidis]|uniref:uncharacterized protein LOC113550126 n=1 Tax=Rhopalosiphum maidis TaxID=43146 RepID=UPI000EFE8C6D|nr:uncharacterized protein LOC113550126 [Rhopalosiphum maidis]